VPISGCENTAVAISLVIGLCRVVLVLGLDEAHCLMDRDGRQLYPVGDIAQARRCYGTLVREYSSTTIAPRSSVLTPAASSPSPCVFGIPAKCQHHHAGIQYTVVQRLDAQPSPVFETLLQCVVAQDADALGHHRLVQSAAQVMIEARQDFGAAVDQRRLDPEAVEDIGELDGDIATAGNHDRFRGSSSR
jgi:hypothetical protein